MLLNTGFYSLLVLAVKQSNCVVNAGRSSSLSSLLPLAFVGPSSSTSSSGNNKIGSVCQMSSTAAAAVEEETKSKCASYEELVKKLQTVTQLQRAQAVLNYDQMVFMSGSDRTNAARGAQLSAMASIIHEKATDPAIKELLEKAEAVTDDEKRVLELELKSYLKTERIPAELEAKRASLSAAAYGSWVKARQADDFSSFEPVLSDCFQTAMDIAKAQLGDNPDNTPLYNQMLDEFEMGMDAGRIDDIFEEIQNALVPLIVKVLGDSAQPPSTKPLEGTFPIDAQKELNRKIVTQLGFDEEHGRIDVSVHPFTMSFSPSDVRITSRFSESEWYQGLAGTIHEGGHAMYEQNLGESDLSIDTALSMGVHESQSLFWERHVGLSKAFYNYATPLLKEAFTNFDYTPQEVYGAVNAVSRSLIRVEADELTYPLHVILRYNIERDLVEGKLDVKDIPARWNEAMKTMLDVDVPSDTKGCLQDVHWSGLAIGYFPTYLLGSATAAQLAYYCEKDIPNMYQLIEKGEFAEIKAWLNTKVHKHGRRYPSLDALLEAEVGEKLNPKYFIDYLTSKYTDLYKC